MAHDRIVVVGGGIAGVSCAAGLRSRGYDGEVVLLDPGELPYDRPPLSKDYLAGASDLSAIALQPGEWYAEHDIELRPWTEVTAVTPTEDDVALAVHTGTIGGTVHADHVVLATGGTAVHPDLPGIDGPRVHLLREYADADRLRAALAPGRRLVIAGAGLIGAEVASTARMLGCEVTVVDPDPMPLAGVVGEPVARLLHARHADFGVTTLTARLDELEDHADAVEVRLAPDGDAEAGNGETTTTLHADAVLVAVGMEPQTDLAVDAGLEVDDGIVVDSGQRSSHPRVLAVGDAARHRDRTPGEHWEAARLDGEAAAATLCGEAQPARGAAWFWTDRYEQHIEVVGEPASAAERVERGTPGEDGYVVFGLDPADDGDASTVVGAVAFEAPKAIRAARRLIDRRISVDPGVLADPDTDLRQLLRKS